jgi:[1-hydroxy-2-(trimethylamino)ethyl]phosphonate dioxygenase
MEHALQAAELAEREGAPDHLVVAALLHDVGHLLEGQNEDLANRGLDGRHEEAGCSWLVKHFGPTLTEPIRLHKDYFPLARSIKATPSCFSLWSDGP